ncbi:MAG: TldD/PmbA family protein, partial [Thermoplasmata archaeon]|nr:TldD/PmbA family protein [Thermoplasmata archaeon]
ARRKVLIEKGVLRSYLHTHSTAVKFSTETTGNASGGEKMSSLLPEGWQTRLSPGNRSWEEILGDVKRGLYIANTWYTRYQDRRGGDFSTIPRDGIFLVEDGEIKEAWGGVRISENMLHLLMNVVELSREVVPVHWWGEANAVFSPHALVDDVKVTMAR